MGFESRFEQRAISFPGGGHTIVQPIELVVKSVHQRLEPTLGLSLAKSVDDETGANMWISCCLIFHPRDRLAEIAERSQGELR